MTDDLMKQAVSYAIAETKKIVSDEWEAAMREMVDEMRVTAAKALKERDATIEAQAAEIEKIRGTLKLIALEMGHYGTCGVLAVSGCTECDCSYPI